MGVMLPGLAGFERRRNPSRPSPLKHEPEQRERDEFLRWVKKEFNRYPLILGTMVGNFHKNLKSIAVEVGSSLLRKLHVGKVGRFQ
jgi:hypothetical protein